MAPPGPSPVGPPGAGPVTCGGTATPSGTVSPRAGPWAGHRVAFGDRRNKHTKVGGCSVHDLVRVLADRSLAGTKALEKFHDETKAGNIAYGSQLGKEGVSSYRSLVLDALEQGSGKKTARHYAAGRFIGISVKTKGAQKRYTLYVTELPSGDGDNAHLFPS